MPRTIWFNAAGQLRNGWWMLIFVGFIAITRLLYGPVTTALEEVGISGAMQEPVPFLFVLGVTWICLALRRESLADGGLAPDWQRLGELAAGFFIACGVISLIALMMSFTGSVAFERNVDSDLMTITRALYVFLFAALMEETLFRGFLFQRMVAGTNARIALVSFALLFAAGHWTNPEMTGSARFWGSLDIALGAVVFGMAYLRSGSLALPVGLHVGWNWMQGAIFGFNVSGHGHTGWLQPTIGSGPDWLTGGGFGMEATIFASALDLCLIAVLWRWKKRPERLQDGQFTGLRVMN